MGIVWWHKGKHNNNNNTYVYVPQELYKHVMLVVEFIINEFIMIHKNIIYRVCQRVSLDFNVKPLLKIQYPFVCYRREWFHFIEFTLCRMNLMCGAFKVYKAPVNYYVATYTIFNPLETKVTKATFITTPLIQCIEL